MYATFQQQIRRYNSRTPNFISAIGIVEKAEDENK
jgi:hypothetical protein